MSYMKGRLLPLAGVAALCGFLLHQTWGGANEPRTRASKPPDEQAPVSETLLGASGLGGKSAADRGGPNKNGIDHEDARLWSNSPDALSKKNPAKARDMERDKMGPLPPGNDGKHIGDRNTDLPWKKGETE